MKYKFILEEFRHRREYAKMQFSSGRTVKEIAEELGVSRQRVYAMLGGIRSAVQKPVIEGGARDGSANN